MSNSVTPPCCRKCLKLPRPIAVTQVLCQFILLHDDTSRKPGAGWSPLVTQLDCKERPHLPWHNQASWLSKNPAIRVKTSSLFLTRSSAVPFPAILPLCQPTGVGAPTSSSPIAVTDTPHAPAKIIAEHKDVVSTALAVKPWPLGPEVSGRVGVAEGRRDAPACRLWWRVQRQLRRAPQQMTPRSPRGKRRKVGGSAGKATVGL